MSALEYEILQRLTQLDETQKQKVLDFMRQIEPLPSSRTYTASELMQLPFEERSRILAQQFQLAAEEDFELFEAYGEEDLLDYSE